MKLECKPTSGAEEKLYTEMQALVVRLTTHSDLHPATVVSLVSFFLGTLIETTSQVYEIPRDVMQELVDGNILEGQKSSKEQMQKLPVLGQFSLLAELIGIARGGSSPS